MKEPEITSLYKYRAVNEQTLQLLINKKIWLAKPVTFNDPFELKHILNPHFTRVEYNECIKLYPKDQQQAMLTDEIFNKVKADAHRITDINRERLESVGIYSLSEEPKDLLMWAHYSDDHKGICIEFEREPNNDLGRSMHTHKVEYLDQLPLFTSLDIIKNLINPSSLFLSKSSEWGYEREWRIIHGKGDCERPLPGRIKNIWFGLRTSDKHKELIANCLINCPEINYRQIHRDPCSYSLYDTQHKINRIP